MTEFIAKYQDQPDMYNFIVGETHSLDEDSYPELFNGGYKKDSILISRYYYLENLNNLFSGNLQISLKVPDKDYWKPWKSFPTHLVDFTKNAYGVSSYALSAAIDVHRSMLSNEIVIESDYLTYEENYDAIRIIGAIIERKGFIPHYYFSGNKSIHLHVFFDWGCLNGLDQLIKDQLRLHFKNSFKKFQNKFILWLRERMINCWDTLAKKFDKDLIKCSHLIRAELSRNKLGFKTFLGHTHKDLTYVTPVRNEINGLYPKLGAIRLSAPAKINQIVEEFYHEITMVKKKRVILRKNNSLTKWVPVSKVGIRECVKVIMGPEFMGLGDGYQRGMFILVNELRRTLGDSEAMIAILDWNQRLKKPLKEEVIKYRFKTKLYSLNCKYVHAFLEEMNIDISRKCNGKIYIS